MPKLLENESKTIRKRVAITFTEPSKTKQEYKDSCDINKIIKRFMATGELPIARSEPLYADVSQIPDFTTAMNKLMEAQELFDSYPAEVRNRFQNDPGMLFEWATRPENFKEAAQLGIIPRSSENLTKAPKNDKISAVDVASKAVDQDVKAKA